MESIRSVVASWIYEDSTKTLRVRDCSGQVVFEATQEKWDSPIVVPAGLPVGDYTLETEILIGTESFMQCSNLRVI